MTDKLKCPFCGEELQKEYNRNRDTVIYRCDTCYFQGDGILWQALIDYKKTRDALKEARVLYSGIVGSYCSSLSYFGMDTSPANLMKEFDEKIKSITKQGE